MDLKTFQSLPADVRVAHLEGIRDKFYRSRSDFLFALASLAAREAPVARAARAAWPLFKSESGWFDPEGMPFDEQARLVREALEREERGFARLLEAATEKNWLTLNKEIKEKMRAGKAFGRIDGPFDLALPMLNALREDTHKLLLAALEPGEKIERAYLAFYSEAVVPFRDVVKSLDDNTAVSLLTAFASPEAVTRHPGLGWLAASLEKPYYLLLLLTPRRLLAFLRDHLQSSRASLFACPHGEITKLELRAADGTATLELTSRPGYLEIPNLHPDDAKAAHEYVRTRAIETIESTEDLVELDLDREIRKLEALYKSGTVANDDYLFRKKRLQKMELEKYSEKNLERILAKRFETGGLDGKVERDILEKFTREKTVMFTDMVGFSSKAADRVLLDTVSLLAYHDHVLVPIIRKYDGTVIKKIGDALMASFDDPAAACRAAREMQGALIRHNAANPEKILIRIGLNTGTVFVKGSDIFGDAVNVAARMESMAEPGMILVTASTRAKVGDAFPARDLGERTVKGQKTAVHIFALVDETRADESMLTNARELGFTFADRPDAEPAAGNAVAPPAAPSAGPAAGPATASASAPAGEPAKDDPAKLLEEMRATVIAGFRLYSRAVTAGVKRSPEVEAWFQRYLRDLHPTLKPPGGA